VINYHELFTRFRTQIATDAEAKTPDITKKIKGFFASEFREYFVAPANGEKEFLVDVFVSTRDPRTLSEASDTEEFKTILAVESELGGEGGGAQGYLKRNVLEDFAKLLVIQSEYKILIFTSLPYVNEKNHLENRVREIDLVYRSAGSPGDILLVHLQSEAQKTAKGHPTNPKVSLKQDGISAYVLSKDLSVQQLA
jgi:hypothetical protein